MMNFGDDFSEKVLRGLSVVCTAAIVLYSPVFSMAANKTVHIAKLGDTDDYTTIRATRSGNNDYVRAICHSVWSNDNPKLTQDFKKIRLTVRSVKGAKDMTDETVLEEGKSASNIRIKRNLMKLYDVKFLFYGNSKKYKAEANVGYNPM